jgi:hypothetical protein
MLPRFLAKITRNWQVLGVHPADQRNAFTKGQWVGKNVCGPSSVVAFSLLSHDLRDQAQVYRNCRGYGDYFEDHCFLYLDGGKVIDPTYRQFLKDPLSVTNPIFVGEPEQLETLVEDKESMRHWEMQENITDKVCRFLEENKLI